MPRNVLYIDDDEGLRRLVSRGLEREGIRVVCASDGESGLRALAAEEFDVIALDQNMPGSRRAKHAWRAFMRSRTTLR